MAPNRGSRRKQAEAISGLKDALTRQFGAQAQSVVEAQVEMHFGGTKRQIGREDLNAIERGIVESLREKRGGVPRREKPLSRSAPSLKFTSSSVAPSVGGVALPPPTPALPTLPLGSANPGALVRSASTNELPTAPKKPIRPAPYGLSITGGTGFEHKDNPDSTRSGVRCVPRYPVPLPPKLKPTDHWDLLVAFDSQKFKSEEKQKFLVGNQAKKDKFKKVLDDQMVEMGEARDLEKKGLLEERELMLAQVEENKKYHEEERAKEQKKKDIQNQMNTQMLGHIDIARKKNEEKKQRECESVTKWLAEEKAQREEEERLQHIEFDRKCKKAREEMEAAKREKEERRRQEQEHELYLMGVRNRILKEQEDAKAKALQDRKDRMAKIEASLGDQVAKRDKEEEEALERKIRQIQDEANHKAREDIRKKNETHAAKVKDMLATRERQIAERGKDDILNKQEEKRLLELYRKEHEDQQRKDKEKQDKARQARDDMDKQLIAQMRRNVDIHPQHVMMTPRNKKTELSYNKALFEQMADEGFKADAVNSMMLQSQSLPDAHPEGKLIAHPTIPRFKGDIHELELEAPDV